MRAIYFIHCADRGYQAGSGYMRRTKHFGDARIFTSYNRARKAATGSDEVLMVVLDQPRGVSF